MSTPQRIDVGRAGRALARGAAWIVVLQAIACGSDPLKPQDPGSSGCETTAEGCPRTTTISVEVSADQPTFVKLGVPAVVSVDDAKTSRDWDLSFQGYEVSTNGGISGPGVGSAFGPLAASHFAFPDEPVDEPFLIEDRAEGAFLRWYAYDGETHTIYSRHHIYAFRSNDVFYKLQVLSYYGEVAGAPVSALYRVRYADVREDENGETRDVSGIDGTVDGGSTEPDAPSGCLALATGEQELLRPAEASESTDWDVCFRRDAISVNGELGGPGDVAAVDLSPNTNEPVADVKGFTAENTEEAFDAVDHAVLSDPALEYRGDYRTSAFTNKWVDRSSDPPVPVMSSAWLVVGADGISRYLVGFQSFDGSTAEAPGRLELYVHPSP